MPQIYAWRLASSKRRDSALSGLGSALPGGRWNPLGTRVIYCAASLALAVLEVRVHLPVVTHPPKQRFVGIELGIAEDAIEVVPDHRLPAGWRVAPKTSAENTAARRFGQRWVEEARSVALRLPSAVIPTEWIYLLNPAHQDFDRAVHRRREIDVVLDPRLWT
jgi:RES domain-containing protein